MRFAFIAITFLIPLMAFADWLPDGKKRTAKEIRLEAVINASPEAVFQLWTTNEATKRFLGIDADIENKQGGKYFIYFDPNDRRQSSEGARILRYEPSKFLSFEWRGTPNMPEMNIHPYPTWVEIQFEQADAKNSMTRILLQHFGFGEGGSWDHAYQFFSTAWQEVLNRLQGLFNKAS